MDINISAILKLLQTGERKRRSRCEKFSEGRMLLLARRQILGRDLRIQILALVRVRETDCRIRGETGVSKERVFSVFFCFFLPFPWSCHRRSRSARFPTVSQTLSRFLFIEQTDLHVCEWKSLFTRFLWSKSATR